MNENIKKFFNRIKDYWNSKTKKQKITGITAFIIILLLISGITYFTTRTTMVPLYSNLEPSETGSIKQSLDAKGINSVISDNGKTINVPKQDVDNLKVELASEGIPKTGSIDYSFFSQNASFGMTDNEFNVIKLDAMQTELSNLIKQVDGVENAKVMINMPDKGIFVNDPNQQASASVVLTTKPGYEFTDKQIKALYNLVSKSVPNLPTDNIVIMNQNFEYFDLNNDNNSTGSTFAEQMDIKHQIERDIQRQVQTMLGTLIGYDKVVTSVTADIDFTQENTDENLVEPVDKQNMKGIAVSAQKITETYSGNGAAAAGGNPGQGSPADSGSGTYVQNSTNGNGDYEKIQETMNYEVNKIHNQIVQSPYKIRDLGIQVMVEPPNPKNPSSLPQSRIQDINKILSTIISTSIDKTSGTNLSNQAIQNKIAVSVQPFNGKTTSTPVSQAKIPWWVYVIGGGLVLIIGLLIFFMLQSRRKKVKEEDTFAMEEPIQIADVNEEHETESTLRKKQLEKMAKDKPDEFAKLLRTWLSEE